MSRPIVAIQYYFEESDYNNAIFAPGRRDAKALFMKAFRAFMEERGISVVTIDCADVHDLQFLSAVYFDYSWRFALRDSFLNAVPFEKRALVMIEPSNVNPSLYFVPFYRNRFSTVFTWDLSLLAKYPRYTAINVPLGAEPSRYRDNPFPALPMDSRKFLIAVSRNRHAYMPQSTYAFRRKAYLHFAAAHPQDFDLFGEHWDPGFPAYRGVIEGDYDAKVRKMSAYRFSLCIENNASEPGYVSEKITDCFCARCVPVYYGSPGIAERIPQDAWIDMKAFPSYAALDAFLSAMSESQYSGYLAAIERFLHGDSLSFFSTEHLFQTIWERLSLALDGKNL